jgi:putative oxidoreductase
MRMFLERLRPYAPLTLRLVVGAVFILFGMHKVLQGGMDPYVKTVTTWGLPAFFQPKYVGMGIGWGSFVGGILVAAGLFTRVAALILTGILVLVTLKTKLHAPYVFEGTLDVPAMQLAATISLVLSGAGRFSLDRRFFGGI